jgi:hypothetical protein
LASWFHAGFPAFSGGYAGVDVFFVISGFLITRIILGAIDAGEFSFIGFFINRVRRLFRALLTTVAISVILGGLLFSPPAMKKLAEAAIVSVLGLSNIYFWSEAGYWDIDSTLKPLLLSGHCRSRSSFIYCGRRCCCLSRPCKRRGARGLRSWHRLVLQVWLPQGCSACTIRAQHSSGCRGAPSSS